MKILTVCVVAALAVSAVAGAYAADANKAVVNRDWTDSVAPAHQDAYEAGQKAFNQCLREHGVKYNMLAYTHETGNTYKYSYVTGPYTWADFDAADAAIKPCIATWRAQGNPHLDSETGAFMVDQPDMSHLPAGWATQPPPPILHVIYFTLKPGHDADMAFTDAVKKIAAAAAKTKWPYYFRMLQMRGGDEGSPDYLLVIANKSWAEAGAQPNPSVWKMVENAYGKADADAMRKSLNDATARSSDHFDRYNADLSYVPGK